MIQLPRLRRGTKPYQDAVKAVRALVHARHSYWSAVYGITYGKVAIRKQKTRWGSCSKKGNLNFNYRLGFLPAELVDYVIVHELCHIAEHNHGPKFWALVGQSFPAYKALRARLHTYRF
jgi:predicted metal-dependent hydrolase